MALLRVEGFDHQNTSTDLISDSGAFVWRSANAAVALTAYGSGIGGIGKAITGANSVQLYGVLTTPLSAAFIGMALDIDPSPGSAYGVYLWNSVTQNPNISAFHCQIAVSLNPVNGQISVYRDGTGGGPVLGQTGNNAFTNNTGFYLEIGVVVATGTSGSVVVKVNGTTVLNITGVNTSQDGNAIFDTIQVGGGVGSVNGGNGCLTDHMYICDSTGGSFNTFLGPIQVYTLFPSAAGASTQYTPLSGTNVSQVQETAMDSDTTYNFDSTIGDEDLFTIQTLPVNVAPLAVQVTGAYRQDSGGTRAMANLLDSSGTVSTGTSIVLNTVYTYQHDVYTLNPNGSVAWTRATVDAAQIGYKTTA